MPIHVPVHMGLAGLKAHAHHHLGMSKAAGGSSGGGGGGGGSSHGSSAMEYALIFATVKLMGYQAATYFWATFMGAVVGGPVGLIVGMHMATEGYKNRQQARGGADVDKQHEQELARQEEAIGEITKVEFYDQDGDKNVFERREQGGIWYKNHRGETLLVDSIEYRDGVLWCGEYKMPLRPTDRENVTLRMRVMCNLSGTQHQGLSKSRAWTGGEKEAAKRGAMAGCCLGCGAGAACGAGVGWSFMQMGDLGGSSIAQTLMIKHCTCPAAGCGGMCGGGICGLASGACCSAFGGDE